VRPNAAQLRQLRKDNLRYSDALVPVPRAEWPVPPFLEESERLNMFRSRQFLVQLFREKSGHLRLSVNRTEWDERANRWREDIAWDDLQRLKAQAGFPDAWAVEVFPPEQNVVNVANMRHLFILDHQPAFGWHGRRQVAA
jgi:hypothetical protein